MNSNCNTHGLLPRTRRFHCAFVVALLFITVGIITVNSAHAATFVVSNTNGTGTGSFRQAIESANANPGADLVRFDIPGSGVKTIFLQGALSTSVIFIDDTVFIDGWTQGGPDYQGPPLIELRCRGGEGTGNCLELRHSLVVGGTSASSSTIRGLIISESPGTGILISGALVDNITIQGCYIGTDASGTGPGLVPGFGINLIRSSHNLIGGAQASQRNVISANGSGGINMFDFSEHNRIEGNYIGTNRTGSAVLPNLFIGISIFGSSHNRVGGTAPGQGNVISGNLATGVDIHGPGSASSNRVEGNYIGTLADGVSPAGNHGNGVVILAFEPFGPFQSERNYVGGVTSAAGNVICDNGGAGILLSGAERSVIQHNLIGVGADGQTSLGNHAEGILAQDSSLNFIGGIATIGQFSTAAGNTIAFNSRAGVFINRGHGNLISRNSIWDNGGRVSGLGIDLFPAGVTLNDDCDLDTGSNRFQNFPIIDQVVHSPGVVTIGGVLLSSPPGLPRSFGGNGMYEIEFFANRACSGTGNGQGETFIGSITVVLHEGRCSARFEATFNVRLPAGSLITATATDSRNNTSEFSECFPVAPGV